MSERTPKPAGEWSGRHRGGILAYWGLNVFLFLLRLGGLRAAYALNSIVALGYVFAMRKSSRASQQFLLRTGAIGPGFWSRWMGTWKHYRIFGQLLIDRGALIALGHEKFRFEFDGEEELHATLKEGRGAVLITGHIGSFEASTHMLFRLQVPVHIVAFDAEADRIREFLDRVLKNKYFSVLKLKGTAEDGLEIMSILRRGEIVALLGDRVMSTTLDYSTPVGFMGESVRFPTGPYHIAALSGAPLISGFVIRRGTYDYHFRANPAKYLKFTNKRDREPDIQRWAQEFANELEEAARMHPFQWRNFYAFWDPLKMPNAASSISANHRERTASMSEATASAVSVSSRTTGTSERTNS